MKTLLKNLNVVVALAALSAVSVVKALPPTPLPYAKLAVYNLGQQLAFNVTSENEEETTCNSLVAESSTCQVYTTQHQANANFTLTTGSGHCSVYFSGSAGDSPRVLSQTGNLVCNVAFEDGKAKVTLTNKNM